VSDKPALESTDRHELKLSWHNILIFVKISGFILHEDVALEFLLFLFFILIIENCLNGY